ncbi:Hypp7190 [Branchiostoma lanceolatum]|uniref:Hypp7190 protein n=1 Tax=Branchiostoma lanceolatum TaxID=7740 RepID=A0A8J9YY94_BRALA|nr:Hypp7190 [Branchiostoma lanceolatum]
MRLPVPLGLVILVTWGQTWSLPDDMWGKVRPVRSYPARTLLGACVHDRLPELFKPACCENTLPRTPHL